MRRFGANKTALHFRRKQPKEDNGDDEGAAPGVAGPFNRVEEGDKVNHAQEIVKELYHRYEKQVQRWRDYRNLFSFLGFVALFLAVLYLQRNSHIAYKVHSTIASVVVPTDDTMSSTDDVYAWLQSLLQEVWQDPVCGDGLCESPFEFASYGRFGCRADCGRLADLQNLTTVQIDIYFNFQHPTGSMAASELMSQASWNLCPISGAPASDCYYDTDLQFTQLAGEQHVQIDDVPDGSWAIRIRRDTFNKISGAVRIGELQGVASYYHKVYVSYTAAKAEQDYEIAALQQARILANLNIFEWTAQNWTQTAGSNLTSANLQNIITASCYCGAIGINGTDWLLNTTWRSSSGNPTLFDVTAFMTSISAIGPLTMRTNASDPNVTSSVTLQGCPSLFSGAPASSVVSSITWPVAYVNDADFCNRTASYLAATSQFYYWDAVRKLLIEKRLGQSGLSGKAFERSRTRDALKNYIYANQNELHDDAFVTPRGTDPAVDPLASKLDDMSLLFVNGITYSIDPPPAFTNLSRGRVYRDPLQTMPLFISRIDARLTEIAFQLGETNNIKMPVNTSALYFVRGVTPTTTMTVSDIVSAYRSVGATNVTVPTTQSLPGQLNLQYNYVVWPGNTTAYLTCDLPDRAPAYIGTCKDMPVTCPRTGNETQPFSCVVINTGNSITGNLSSITYRDDCEIPCEHKLDCDRICECYSTCTGTQICECSACTDLGLDPRDDTEFMSIEAAAQLGGASSASIADSQFAGRRRKLLQGNDSLANSLSEALTKLDTVRKEQQTLQTQVSDLSKQIQEANTLAQQRANDKTLEQLIQAGRQDIQAGQARVESKLDEILGKQNEIQASAAATAAALQSIKDLSQKTSEATLRLEKRVTDQLMSIKVAAQGSIITLAQALELWKRARRDRMDALKAARLSNIPCNQNPAVDNSFDIARGNAYDVGDQHRERNIGLTNRVIGGLLLHTWRTREVACSKSRFDQIQSRCTGGLDTAPYGVDPVFKLGTSMFNADLTDANGTIVLDYYNCSELGGGRATYNLNNTLTQQVTNPAPYCAELYNPRELPWGFHHFPLQDMPVGFPVWFDIDLSADDAQKWFSFLQDGLYLDSNTRGVIAQMVTYNAELRIFGAVRIKFFFGDGGSIKMTYRLHTLRVELYHTYEDHVRFAFEIILTMVIFVMLLIQFYHIALAQKELGNALKYFKSGWNWLELISNCLLTSCIIMWWSYVKPHAKRFDIDLSYAVYDSLSPAANFLKLGDNGGTTSPGYAFTAAWNAFSDLDVLVGKLNLYYALNGINILLLIARVLKLMDFQPRLGVVTRSLALAGPDLIHFSLVCGMVFVGYAMMAHLIFGNAIDEFSTFGSSVNTCFEILLGNIDVNQQLRALSGLQNLAGTLFFWSYELLVFMVLLNFLLAIIVDAFSEVKENTHETVGLHTELGQIIRDKWRSLVGVCTGNYISDRKLGMLLKQWAGEDSHAVQAQRADEGIKKLKVLGEEIDEEALREILQACLQDGAGTAEEPDEKTKRGLAALFGRKKTGATQEEIDLAAKYVIDRFGTAVDKDDGEEEVETVRTGGTQVSAMREAAMEKERDQLAQALERLAEVQRELAEGQRNLMSGQKQLADQQARLVNLMNNENPGS